jgi:hypothetical protein
MWFVEFLARTNFKQSRLVILAVTNEQVLVLAEIAANALQGNIPLKKTSVPVLRKIKRFLGRLSDRKSGYAAKKLLLKNNVKSLVSLLEITLPALKTLT